MCLDIFELAKDNVDNLKDEYNRLKDKHSDPVILEKFKTFVEENWTISINFRPNGLRGFLEDGIYLNAYEVAEKISKNSNVSYEAALKGILGDSYERRITFDKKFNNSRKFKYGALYIGGLGATKYGSFCVIFRRKVVRGWKLVFLKTDSLNYVSNGDVDIERLKRDLANKETVHFLVAVTHHSQVDDCPTSEREKHWGSLVCNDDKYIDSITVGDIKVEHIDCVKIDGKKLRKCGTKAYIEDPSLDDANGGFVDDIYDIIKLLEERNINVKVVE